MKQENHSSGKQIDPKLEERRAGKPHAVICEGFTFQPQIKIGGGGGYSMKTLLPLIIILVFLLQTNASESNEILQILRTNDAKIKKIVGSRKTSFTDIQKVKIKALFDNFFNFKKMSSEILKSHWDRLNTQQTSIFINAFSSLLKESSLRDLSLFQSEIIYKNVDVKGDIATVSLYAIKDSKRIKVIYKMKNNKKTWKIFDFLLDGVSTVESYQISFNRIIRENSFATLILKIKQKIFKLKK